MKPEAQVVDESKVVSVVGHLSLRNRLHALSIARTDNLLSPCSDRATRSDRATERRDSARTIREPTTDPFGLRWGERAPKEAVMSDAVADSLVLDLLEWIGPGPRPYLEVLEAWRTSCPRLPVWEEANDRGLIVRHHEPGRGQFVSVSAAGWDLLRERRSLVR